MTEIQKHLMALVSEINETCQENKIPYALFGQTAGCAIQYGKFTTQCYPFQIMMFAKDILTLKQQISKKEIPNRAFEDFSVNEKLAFNYIRYVDTNTTLLDREDPVDYNYLGVAVTIIPLYIRKLPPLANVLARGNVYVNGGLVCDRETDSEVIKKSVNTVENLRELLGAQWVATRLYELFEKEQGVKVKKNVRVQIESDLEFKLPATVLLDTVRVTFEGRKLPVPANAEEYFKKLYGKNWESFASTPMTTANSINVISDAETPFSEYLIELEKAGIDIHAIRAKIQKYNDFMVNIHKPYSRLSDNTFRCAQRSAARIDLYVYYKGHMKELKEAAESGNIKKLEKLMEKYTTEATKYYKKYNLGFYINPELHEYANMVWQAQGKKDLAEKILKLVPKEYLEKDMETFLKGYIDLS